MMSTIDIENQIADELKHQWDQNTEQESVNLEREVKKWNQVKETKINLWKLRRNTFFERKWNNIYYKIESVSNYLKEISTSNKKIKETLLKDRKTLITAVQIALYKAWTEYLPVGWIDWQRWPITRWAVAKFQEKNWLKWQKNPWYLNIQTISKLIEVSAKKEIEKKQDKKPVKKESTKKQISISAPNNQIIEQPDKTRIAKKPIIIGSKKIDLTNTIPQKQQIETEKKWWTMEEVRLDISKKVWNFREWHNWDFRFAFYNDKNGDLPETITICGETYKYNGEQNNLNWLWFETYDGWRAFQLWTYTNGTLEEWFRFYFDGEKEVGEFDYVWDLKNGIRIDANWIEHKVENWVDI